MVRVFVGVGSNLGDRSLNFWKAERMLSGAPGIEGFKKSSIYETDPIGGPPQDKFLNAVWEFKTNLSPEDLLDLTQTIEKKLRRKRLVDYGPRTIDLDILFYGDQEIQTDQLLVPHPRLHEREFVLKPLSELAPNWKHPVRDQSVRSMLKEVRESYKKS